MSSFKQIKALFVYHATVNPWLWTFPVVFIPQVFKGASPRHIGNLGIETSATIAMLWLPMYFAAILFGQGKSRMASAHTGTHFQMQIYNAEFIATRAVDRGSIYWARAAVFWCLILMPVAVWMLVGFRQPSFNMDLSADKLRYYLEMLPGSSAEKAGNGENFVLTAPLGALWLNVWTSVLLITVATASQLYISLITTLRRSQFYYWAGMIFGIALACSPIFGRSAIEKMFLLAVNNPLALGIVLTSAITASLMISKRRFLDQEF